MVAGQYERAVLGFSRVPDPPTAAQWLLKFVVVVDSFQLCHSNRVSICQDGNHAPEENKSCLYFIIMCYFFFNGTFLLKDIAIIIITIELKVADGFLLCS